MSNLPSKWCHGHGTAGCVFNDRYSQLLSDGAQLKYIHFLLRLRKERHIQKNQMELAILFALLPSRWLADRRLEMCLKFLYPKELFVQLFPLRRNQTSQGIERPLKARAMLR